MNKKLNLNIFCGEKNEAAGNESNALLSREIKKIPMFPKSRFWSIL